MKTEAKGIYQKLQVIQEQVLGLGKDKQGNNYRYVTGSKVLEHLKPMMNDLKLLLKQEILSIENVRQDYTTRNGSKSEINSKVMMRFTWIDSESGEKDENSFGANGQNDWDKGVGSALTYAERYFLLKYFHINTDEDDIDNPDRETSAPVPVVKEKPMLTKMNGKDMTKEWISLTKGVNSGAIKTVEDAEKYFTVPNNMLEELIKLLDFQPA